MTTIIQWNFNDTNQNKWSFFETLPVMLEEKLIPSNYSFRKRIKQNKKNTSPLCAHCHDVNRKEHGKLRFINIFKCILQNFYYFILFYFLVYVHECFASKYVGAPISYNAQRGQKESSNFTGTRHLDGCIYHVGGCWESNPGSSARAASALLG